MGKVYVFAGIVTVIAVAVTYGVILYKASTFKRRKKDQ